MKLNYWAKIRLTLPPHLETTPDMKSQGLVDWTQTKSFSKPLEISRSISGAFHRLSSSLLSPHLFHAQTGYVTSIENFESLNTIIDSSSSELRSRILSAEGYQQASYGIKSCGAVCLVLWAGIDRCAFRFTECDTREWKKLPTTH